MVTSTRIVNLLGYAGLLPFVVPAVLVLSDSEYSALSRTITGVYAFGIIAFLSGSWWGLALTPGRGVVLLVSNICFLLALLCFLFLPQWWALMSALLLLGILLTERYADFMPFLDDGYRSLRRNLTLIAGGSLLALQIGA